MASLKDINKIPLATVAIANALIVFVLASSTELLASNFDALADRLNQLVPTAIGIVVVGIANAQISPLNKARIVFGRWDNPLPGARAFSHYVDSDPRIGKQELLRIHGTFPVKPAEQNALWYKLYRTIQDEDSVQQAHREFLFARDYAAISFFFIPLLGGIAIVYFDSRIVLFSYLAFLILQFISVRRAAQNHGIRLVTTVLAIKSTDA